MTPVKGPMFGSMVFLALGIVPPVILLFAVESILLGGGFAHLAAGVAGLLVFCLVLRMLMVVVADKSGVWVTWKLTGQTRLTPWSDIERLEGTRYRARLILRDSGKRRTIAGFDPHWRNRRVQKVIAERIAATPRLPAS